MPNGCENNLQLFGEPKLIADTLSAMSSEDDVVIDFQKIMPCPQELWDTESIGGANTPEQIANNEKFGYPDWYGWCIDNWGTQWTAENSSLEYTSGSAHASLNFETAWSSPTPLIKYLSRKHPQVLFLVNCGDPAMGWRDYYAILNGVATLDYINEEDSPDEEMDETPDDDPKGVVV